MIDQRFDRDYREARALLNADIAGGLARLANATAVAFAALNRIEYSAPWVPVSRDAR